MDDVRARWLRPDTGALQTPVAQLVCNFAEGVDGKPPLLTHDDVTTLFHEFGHGLHHMLTQINERDVSGISGVEWDAVELPSQFMENFCWEWDVLAHMTSHVDTGEPLPRALFDKMTAAKNFQSGLQTLRQIEFSLFDMLLHTEYDAATAKPGDVMALLGKVRAEVAVMPSPAFSRTPNTFSHIFSGGYAAGYYSYKWAEVLSADAYAAFEETAGANGEPSIETGRKYRQAILEAGGSRSAMESFKAFRGREPQLDALLRHQGMAETQRPETDGTAEPEILGHPIPGVIDEAQRRPRGPRPAAGRRRDAGAAGLSQRRQERQGHLLRPAADRQRASRAGAAAARATSTGRAAARPALRTAPGGRSAIPVTLYTGDDCGPCGAAARC